MTNASAGELIEDGKDYQNHSGKEALK